MFGISGSLIGKLSGSGTPAPMLTSLNFILGDTAGGGLSIIATGTNLNSASNLTIGGNSATITGNTSTTITFTLPAHSVGVVADVTATTPGGTSNALSFEYWDPTQVTGIDCYLDSNKGVTTPSSSVSEWDDQSSNARVFVQAAGANQPSSVSSVFGTLPAIRFSPQQWVGTTRVVLASGLSAFGVMQWTSMNSSAAGAAFGNAPLSLVSDDTGGVVDHFLGASNDTLQFGNNDGTWHTYNRGSGLNDGTPRLLGWTHDSGTNDLKAYSGGAQLGITESGVLYPAGGFPPGYNVVGVDFLDEDGWDGDVGTVVIVSGVISGGDLTKLNEWSQQRFGTP